MPVISAINLSFSALARAGIFTEGPDWHISQAHDATHKQKPQYHVRTATDIIIGRIVLLSPLDPLFMKLLSSIMTLLIKMRHVILMACVTLPGTKSTASFGSTSKTTGMTTGALCLGLSTSSVCTPSSISEKAWGRTLVLRSSPAQATGWS